MPYNIPCKNSMLGAIGITHIGIHTLADPGTGTDANAGEASGGSYARALTGLASAASAQRANADAELIDVPAGTYGFVTFWNAGTGNSGNYLGYAPINGTTRAFGTVDSAGVTSDAIQSAAHGLSNDDRVQVFNIFATSLPAGLTEGTIYYVVQSATDTFEVSATSGGASINITGQGQLYWHRIIPETFASAGQIAVAIGALVHDLTGV